MLGGIPQKAYATQMAYAEYAEVLPDRKGALRRLPAFVASYLADHGIQVREVISDNNRIRPGRMGVTAALHHNGGRADAPNA